MILPDCHVKPGVPLDHLTWAGYYIALKRPDVIVCLGDFADMPSLSSYDVGKKCFEGRRYTEDVRVAREAMQLFLEPIHREQERCLRWKMKAWNPRLVMCLGNHENRIDRAIDSDPKIEGLISVGDLGYEEFGWEVIPYLQPIELNGVCYSHFFTSGVMGRPVSSARMLLAKHHMSCVAGHQQGRDIAYSQKATGQRLTGIISGCLTPDHKILTADLRYIPVGELQVGDKVVSFSEQPEKRRRRYETGVVEAVARDIDDVWCVTLASGKQFKVTKDHQWLAKTGSMYFWRTTESLQIGTQIPKLVDEWETLNTYDAGWLAGIYDGEGSLYARKTSGGHVMQVAVSQKEGLVFDRIKKIISDVTGNSSNNQHTNKGVYQIRINGGAINLAKFLGRIRPKRLLDKFQPEYMGNIACPDSRNDRVVSKEYLGKLEIVRSKIDKGTYISEGYGHHNSYYLHDEDYLTAQNNIHWRGIWAFHEINNGSFDEMPLSIEYLKSKYERRRNSVSNV
jgi:hypothetical protein